MEKDYGKKMGELHLRYKKCQQPFLTDSECVELRDWLEEIYQYNREMGHGINAVYFGTELESSCKVCEARGLK